MPTRGRVASIYTDHVKSSNECGHEPQINHPPFIQGITSPRPLAADEDLIFYTGMAISGLFRYLDK